MKKSSVSIAIAAAVIIFYSIGCSKSNDVTLANGGTDTTGTTTPPAQTCDTVNMKYAANVVPIMQANCYSCHGASSNGGSGGIILDGYANLKKWADNGALVGTITHASGFVAMPFGQAKMSDCNINKIISWVKNGAEDN